VTVARGHLILIVEDNDRNLELVRDLLQVSGYRTLEAIDARSGVAMAVEHHPDLVLMDVQLPDEDGISAMRRIRAHPGLASVPIVALTAFAMRDDRERMVAAGFDGYITKPIEMRPFLDEVARHCLAAP
jgi:two-component system cell cycle response regulator DivK